MIAQKITLVPLAGLLLAAMPHMANGAPMWGTAIDGYIFNRVVPGPVAPCTGCGSASYGNGAAGAPAYVPGTNTSVSDSFFGSGTGEGVTYQSQVSFQGSVTPGAIKAGGSTGAWGPEYNGNTQRADAFFAVQLAFFDDISIVSDTLAPETPVEFDLVWSFTRSASATGRTNLSIYQSLASDGSCRSSPCQVSDIYQHHQDSGDESFGPLTTTETLRMRSFVGSVVRVRGSIFLYSSSDADSGPGGFPSSASGDILAGNSAYTYVNVITPGAGFIAASGASYAASAVPEPGTTALTLVALPVLAMLRRRRRLLS